MDILFSTIMYIIPLVLTIFSQVEILSDYLEFNPDKKPVAAMTETYDYIVVGGGTSGAVIASRLSENPNNKVLLLEAGGRPVPVSQIMGLFFLLFLKPEHDWSYKTVPQKWANQACENKQFSWPRGRVLGGTSVLNFQIYIRGHPYDYDNWSKIVRDERWNYKNVLPYFIKSIDYNGAYKNNSHHYFSKIYKPGPLNVETRGYAPLESYMFDAGRELGFSLIDANGPQRTGLWFIEYTTKERLRRDTYTAFLEPHVGIRKNLKISAYSYATKINFDHHKTATGITYTRHGKELLALARKEIIISGGTVESPKLLQLSGIGPKHYLEKLGIKSVVDLPVGENLQDHVGLFLGPFIINETMTTFNPEEGTLQYLKDFIHKREGPLESAIPCGGQLFFNTKESNALGLDWPNIEMYLIPMSVTDSMARGFSSLWNMNYEKLTKFYKPHYGKSAFHILISLTRPRSKGSIKIRTKDPNEPPLIDPQGLKDRADLDAVLEALNLGLRLAENTYSFHRINATLSTVPFPDCEHLAFRTSQYWECFARSYSLNFYHPVGTVKMGMGFNDPTAVVDSKLRVLGTKNLRVADASIMPVIINGNTMAPCLMIGELVSDLIAKDDLYRERDRY